MKLNISLNSVTIVEIMTAVMVVMKLTGLAELTWLAVFSPLLVSTLLSFVVLTGAGIWKGIYGRRNSDS